jgi:1,4-dihydroxy-2-naphthoate octaprenyltransferase
MVQFRTWIQATRPQFFTVIILPIMLGTAIAWQQQRLFSAFYFCAALLGGVLLHAAINVLNDYFDHLNHCDENNQTPLTPFAGGSRMIQNGTLSPQQVHVYGMVLLLAGIALGLILVWLRGIPIFWIGLIGVLSGYFYSAPPFALCSRGWGEVLVGLNFGILPVVGAYLLQVHDVSFMPVFAALPMTGLVTAILYINQFPDYAADKQVGKANLVVRLGQLKAQILYEGLLIFSFLSLGLGIYFKVIPQLNLLSFLLMPLAGFAMWNLARNYATANALIPAIKSTIALHTVMSLVLILSFLVS